MKKRALISVSDKKGVADFARELEQLGYEIISTGGTYKTLKESGVNAVTVESITGFPECLDGRVKTLHPVIHAGLLAVRDNPEHMAQLEKLNINTIDIVAVNLYPFKETVQKKGVTFEMAVENIDIGGPTMLRSAAKNAKFITVVVDSADYGKVLDELKTAGDVSQKTRLYLMYKVYQHTAVYDTLIADYLKKQAGLEYTQQLTLAFDKAQDLRYGENPHQSGAFYKDIIQTKGSLAGAEQLHGKELSYNNINDTNSAIELLREFERPAVVALKHTNPCGVAEADNILDAYRLAYEADPVSIFGGIIALNRAVDGDVAAEIVKIFTEVIIAPDFTDGALEILTQKKNLRLLKMPDILNRPQNSFIVKRVSGGLLIQDSDDKVYDGFDTVTKKSPTDREAADMLFAMKVVKHVKSNAIVIVKDSKTLGIGAGQTNRIWATEQAIEHCGGNTAGAVLASDAFFPFDDCVTAAADAGITAIVQPGGSIRDEDSVKACNARGLAMVFTHIRHFKH